MIHCLPRFFRSNSNAQCSETVFSRPIDGLSCFGMQFSLSRQARASPLRKTATSHALLRATKSMRQRYGPAHFYDGRSEEHTSELQSQSNLVCRLLLEKKKKRNT